ncbi:MAG: hypothetical protein F4X14_07485 [Caldilineaceae bacterium SB0661_bin_32]|uniref:PIN domain-containing protein n=1 Tax=Caldilineaceae bacterium SB0661_bin_32 TaxID=2605255 RepID=A0A6B1D5E5_9CHLR|nr:hypothetical protein [Caldilineaceae bacterium SB0661_bin_32]
MDTNIWISGLTGTNPFCQMILVNLQGFDVVVPDQVREELERNLSDRVMKQLYRLLLQSDTKVDFALVPGDLVAAFEDKGLKKGDAEIGAFCAWREIAMLVSNNRDFLRGMTGEHSFNVLSPEKFCQEFGLRE